MKRFNKLLCFMLVFITAMAAFCTVSFAATVGQPLTSPEAGWQRVDDNSTKLIYSNGDWNIGTYPGLYNDYQHATNVKNAKVTFKFYGSKLRIISNTNSINEPNIEINIDGVDYTFSEYLSSYICQVLLFEKLNLNYGVHSVTIINPNQAYTALDAIDIDSDGYMIDYYQPTNLKAVPGDGKVDLSWDAVDGATSYIVKRSLTPGGPYETITTTSAITYTDIDVTNGTTYYYVVTAIVNNIESDNSNEASATPTAPTDPEPSGNSAILEITMVTDEIKEYDLTATELQSFLFWYDGRSNGVDKAYYTIPKKNNIKPFLSRKDYIAYDKISSFEVKEYTE